nr:kinesin-like protein KIN12A [Ipomoea batatas]
MADNRFLRKITTSTFRSLLPKSVLSKNKRSSSRAKPKFNNENAAPLHPNIEISDIKFLRSKSVTHKPLPELENSPPTELTTSDIRPQPPEVPQPPVKVVVRIRPGHDPKTGGRIVTNASKGSVSVGDREFTFDSILGSSSTQDDAFQLVGVPLVKDALAGYNTSLLAYGQTGSGKTYTMWGPPSAMVEAPSANCLQGVVPRIFQMLFSNIQHEQETSGDKQRNYQCRCSFLEIFDEHIGDLLDPTQRNLKIKDDAKYGFYVENLMEEYVSTYEDVTRLLIKGLSSRKVGATSINLKSSRSHIVFTCIIESWCKENASTCFGSLKTSRITLVDLAGFERNILEDADIQCVKEGKYVNKSTSQLGHVVNILAENGGSRTLENVPYNSSCLTHLLKESLGGNAKLSVICTISQDYKHMSDTISTLRFGKLVKLMQNDPVINEISEDDVNDLSDQIRLLKEELIRAKTNVNVFGSSDGYLKGQSARESLNQLRVSLTRSLMLPHNVNDFEDDIHFSEDDIKELAIQIRDVQNSYENSKETFESKDCSKYSSAEGCEAECYMSCSESENEEISSGRRTRTALHPGSISINTDHQCPALQDPELSESPKIQNTTRKTLILSSNPSSSGNAVQSGLPQIEQQEENNAHPQLRSNRIFAGPAESLAASLHRGLQIIDHYHQNSVSTRSSISSFSFDHFALKPCMSTGKVKTLPQESLEGEQFSDAVSVSLLCSNCQQKESKPSNEVQDRLNTRIALVNGSSATEQADQEPKDFEKDLLQALEREKKLEIVCKDQTEKTAQLNQMLSKYKCDKDSHSINDKEKLVSWNGCEGNEQDFINEKCVSKEVQGVENHNDCGNKRFDMLEKEALLKEIEDLRSKLQSNPDAYMNKSVDKVQSSLLQSIQERKSGVYAKVLNEEELEKERQRWIELESDWISLTDELRIDLESNRHRAEKVEMELKLQKKCTEELDDALKRAVLGNAKMVEHYAELQEKHNDLIEKHRLMVQGIQDIKKAAAKAGTKGCGARFAKSLASELSALRVERERERGLLKKENRSLKAQLRDTAEAVHAAGELLVRLRESQETVYFAEEKLAKAQEENDKLRKQLEKLKSKHKMEIDTMKHYLAESRLPEAALRALNREESDVTQSHIASHSSGYDDQPWRAEFGAIYQDQHY